MGSDLSSQEEANGEYTCTLATYDSWYNSKGERTQLEASKRRDRESLRKNKRTSDGALVLTRYYSGEKDLERTTLEIQSPHIIRALRDVVKTYPGVDFQSQSIVLQETPMCVFHYRKELKRYSKTFETSNPTVAQHVQFLLRQTCMPPGLDFENLWMAIRPGTFVYTTGQENVYQLHSMSMAGRKSYCYWSIVVHEISHDGDTFGFIGHNFCIHSYKGCKPLLNLRVLPLEYHPRRDEICQKMLARGRKFVELKGSHHCEYEGTADALSPFRTQSYMGEEDESPLQSTKIKSRIMVDCRTFASEVPSNRINLEGSPKLVLEKDDGGEDVFSEDQLLICDDEIPGFTFTTKQWCRFKVDLIRDVKFNSDAFGALILPRGKKDIILSLVTVHTDKSLNFDDLIRGKGKGMVFLLHGVPGVGKTLTAESVADYTRQPLYTISAGELGEGVKSVEKNLSSALALATIWNAVILIDEADIFLEQRTSNDLGRNALVSVFLRLLEYYEGIMFLTTNRIEVFDSAFKSRIHLAIKYSELSKDSRRDLFRMFINSAFPDGLPEWVTDVSLDRLAAREFNGRRIKNAVRTAYALAIQAGKELHLKHIEMALSAMESFGNDFGDEEEQVPKDVAESSGRAKRQRIS